MTGIPRLRSRAVPVAILAALLLALAACSRATDASPVPGSPLPIVTSTAILADFARSVGGDDVTVSSIIPPGADVHTFRLTPGDSARISRARVIITNGAGLDDFLDPAIASARNDRSLRLVIADAIAPPALQHPAAASQHADDDHAAGPHLWLDPAYAMLYAERIRDALAAADPARAASYQRNADSYLRQIRALDEEIARALSAVPASRRVLITFHDAFAAFTDRYGFERQALAGVQGGDVTPQDVVRLLASVRQRGIPAVFAEPQFDEKILRQAAAEAGVAVGTIRSDTLDAQTPTYLAMMRANAASIAALLSERSP